MSTITKERIEQLANGNNICKVTREERIELARIALASLEAEPYGYVHKAAYEQAGSCGLSSDHEAYRDSSTHIAVYTAPPAPVAVPDFGALTKCIVQRLVDYGAADDDAIASAEEFVYNACRDAMLNQDKSNG